MGQIQVKGPKDILVIIILGISVLYLINPTAGIIELIPDNIPLVGNIDEGIATTLIISCLGYFGFDFGNLFTRKK
jgi:uncharacterized membrane protein YkvA (DUF1232 family)